ncbi:MAG: PRC-barrel domain-containing protein [Thermoproteota archaeon]
MSKKFFRRDEIVGKDVISDNAVRLGKVKDIGYDQEGKIVLIYDKLGEGEEEAIPSSQILALGDVVLVKSAVQEKASQIAAPSTKICSKCGRANPSDYLYCAGCGSRLEES